MLHRGCMRTSMLLSDTAACTSLIRVTAAELEPLLITVTTSTTSLYAALCAFHRTDVSQDGGLDCSRREQPGRIMAFPVHAELTAAGTRR